MSSRPLGKGKKAKYAEGDHLGAQGHTRTPSWMVEGDVLSNTAEHEASVEGGEDRGPSRLGDTAEPSWPQGGQKR